MERAELRKLGATQARRLASRAGVAQISSKKLCVTDLCDESPELNTYFYLFFYYVLNDGPEINPDL